MEDIALSLATKAAESLVTRVVRACHYVIFYDRYLRKLKDDADDLDGVAQKVHHSVFEADNNMMQIEAQVKKWETKAKSVADEARNMLQCNEKAKKTCCYGCFPNPKVRYNVAKEAMETVEAIKELISRGQFNKVSYKSAPPGYVPCPRDVNSSAGDRGTPDVNSSAGDGGDTIIESQASIFLSIMKALEDEKHKVIGVFGPGGVGKTTLLEEVEKKLRKEGKPFRWIAKSKVSQTPNIKNIQDDIAYALGLELKDVPEAGRRDLLFKRLQKDPTEKILIILDDLWEKLDLKAVGIRSGDGSMKCKLLLTSRDKRVLEKGMCADGTFRLEVLSHDESFRLFQKTVGNNLQDNEDLKEKADQVVRKLGGLPLLITSVATTLKSSNVYAWKNALIKIEDQNIENIVKLSYDRLEGDETKDLFLLCGLIGGSIQVELLLGLGLALDLFEGFDETIKDARNKLNAMLESLRSFCLLQDGGDDGEIVTIHDLYSGLVSSTPFRGQNSLIMNNNSWSEKKLEKCWAICLMDVGSDRLAKLMRRRFPYLETLMLSQPQGWMGGPAKRPAGDCCKLDFTYMKQLRVLYIRSMHIPNLPSTIAILENLRSLYLDCCDVEDVAILGKLKALQILNFAGSTISKLPKEIGDLTSLRSLNLSDCDELKIIEPSVLKGLTNLEELLMRGSFDQWMSNDEAPSESCNAKLAELKSLTKLTALEISIRDPTILLEVGDLPFGDLTRFWINIGDVDGREFEGLTTMKLKLEGCDGILSKEWIKKTLHKTQHLHLDGLGEFKKSAHELCIQGFPQLKHLDIKNSPSIKYIASSSHGLPLTAFTNLESLFLKNLINLEKICHGLVEPQCFSQLKVVRVKKCDRLKNLWCLSEMQRLVQLEKIEVLECDSMRAVVTDDAGEDKVVTDAIVDLPQLPNMTIFCDGAGITSEGALIQKKEVVPKEEGGQSKADVMSFASLEFLSISECPNFGAFIRSSTRVTRQLGKPAEENDESPQLLFNEMVTFPNIRELKLEGAQCRELWSNQIPDNSFCKLEFLELNRCDNLLRIGPSHMWKRLQSCLNFLRVTSCRLIEIIYESDGTVTQSSKLRTLELRDLENLRHIWQSNGRPNVPLPNLRFIEIRSCPRLRMLFPTLMPEFLEQIKELVVESCEDMELIAGHEECEEATGTAITFSELTALRLFELPKFKSLLPEKYSAEFPSLQVLSKVSCGTEPDKRRGGDWESYGRSTYRHFPYIGTYTYYMDPRPYSSMYFSDENPDACTIC